MEKVFIYWDNSNVLINAQEEAAEREGPSARSRARIHFRNLLDLARAGREVANAVAGGSVPPELRRVWNRMENQGMTVHLFERGALQTALLRDGYDNNGDPGIVVLLTGDGSGFLDGVGFHADLERLHQRGWRIEVISWLHSCNRRLREWAEENGVFIAMDDYYESVTFLEHPMPGQPIAEPRYAKDLDLSPRRTL